MLGDGRSPGYSAMTSPESSTCRTSASLMPRSAMRSTAWTRKTRGGHRSPVGRKAVDRPLAIGCAWQRIAAGRLQPPVTHEFGNQDEVVATAHECCSEGVPEDVTGEVLRIDPGVVS